MIWRSLRDISSSVEEMQTEILNSQLALAESCGYKTEHVKMADTKPLFINLFGTEQRFAPLEAQENKKVCQIIRFCTSLERLSFIKMNSPN